MSAQGNCPPDMVQKSRQLSFGPEIKYIHIFKLVATGAQLNIPVNIAPMPLGPDGTWSIMMVACDNAHLEDSFFMSFNPVNSSGVAGNAIVPIGYEEWFPFQAITAAANNKVGIMYKFFGAVPPIIYFHVGQEAGGGNYQITLAYGPGLSIANNGLVP